MKQQRLIQVLTLPYAKVSLYKCRINKTTYAIFFLGEKWNRVLRLINMFIAWKWRTTSFAENGYCMKPWSKKQTWHVAIEQYANIITNEYLWFVIFNQLDFVKTIHSFQIWFGTLLYITTQYDYVAYVPHAFIPQVAMWYYVNTEPE